MRLSLRVKITIIVIYALAILCVFVFPVRAHDIYTSWRTHHGGSCCNSKEHSPTGDCGPIADSNVRVTDRGVDVFIEGQWVQVRPEQIRPYNPPDMQHHVCHKGTLILCFVYGGGV